jgi:hypothetical protein
VKEGLTLLENRLLYPILGTVVSLWFDHDVFRKGNSLNCFQFQNGERFKSGFSILFFVLISFGVSGGTEYTRDSRGIPLSVNGKSIDLPFTGGLSQPRPVIVDMNGDGLLDLVIGDVNARLQCFLNSGTKENPIWNETDHPIGLIDIGSWFCIADIDADNDPDLFCDSRNGTMRLWRNDFDSLTSTSTFLLKSDEFGGFVTGPYSSPDFADIDSDNDLDFFYGGIGGNLLFHRNIGDAETPVYDFITDFYDSVTAVPGGGFVPPPSETEIEQAAQHGFSTIRFGDINSDGDQDLFWGDINNTSLYLFSNEGGSFVSDLTYVTDNFLPTTTNGFNNTSLGDIDNDGDRDLIIGVGQNQDRDNLWVYPNDGTPFVMQLGTRRPLLDIMDFGTNATVATGDIDADGDFDIIIGSGAGRLVFGENVGTSTSPSFALDTLLFLSLSAGFYTHPELVDVDGDRDLDLLVGNLLGRVGYWRNDGDSSSFQPVLVTSQFADIKVDQLANISLVDMDDDGLRDIVLGEWDFNGFANVLLYENVGTVGNPSFTLLHTAILPRTLREYTGVTVSDIDHNGRKDLLIGGQNSRSQWFRNISTRGEFPDSTTLELMPDTLPWQGRGLRLLAEFADFTGDGTDDVLVVEDDGGLNYYRAETNCCQQMGNVDNDSKKRVNVSDVVLLVDHLFVDFTPIACPAQANLDGDEQMSIDIGDLMVLIDNLFITFAPVAGCR